MYLLDLASRHMRWLSERQAITAANIANADTPGYRARDIGTFASHLADPQIRLAATSPMHMDLSPTESGGAGRQPGASWASSHSGNNVSIEQELMKASSGNRMMSVDAGLMRSFHRMLLSSVKA